MAAFTGFAHKYTNQMDDMLLALEKKEDDAKVALVEMNNATLETILAKNKLTGVDVWEGFDDKKRNEIFDMLTDVELLKIREVRM